MNRILRNALLAAATLLPVQAGPAISPNASAQSAPPKLSKSKKKPKPRTKKLILSGRRHKKQHSGRPA